MPDPNSGYERTDTFDFRYVKIVGDFAYAVYFLKSDVKDKANGSIHKEYLESTILRRSGDGWKIALLHSTKITSQRIDKVECGVCINYLIDNKKYLL